MSPNPLGSLPDSVEVGRPDLLVPDRVGALDCVLVGAGHADVAHAVQPRVHGAELSGR